MQKKIIHKAKCPKCLSSFRYTEDHLTVLCEHYGDKGLYEYRYVRCAVCGTKLVAGKEKLKTI